MNKPKLIVPRDYDRILVRPRVAPPAKVAARAEGWIEWSLIDRQNKVRKGGQQHNLVLNGGLDRLASRQIDYAWMARACVGTGSTAPSVTDTALNTEIGRTATVISSEVTNPSVGVSRINIVLEFDFAAANGNLTEWGIASAAVGELNVRELFRNDLGTPITVTKTSDYKLRINYTFEMELSPSTPTAFSLPITGIGTLSAAHTFNVQAASAARWSRWATGAVNRLWAVNEAWNYSTTSSNQSGSGSITIAADAYVTSSYERAYAGPYTFGTALANNVWRSVIAGESGTGKGRSWGFEIDAGDRFTKDDLHTLTLSDLMTFSWSRA